MPVKVPSRSMPASAQEVAVIGGNSPPTKTEPNAHLGRQGEDPVLPKPSNHLIPTQSRKDQSRKGQIIARLLQTRHPLCNPVLHLMISPKIVDVRIASQLFPHPFSGIDKRSAQFGFKILQLEFSLLSFFSAFISDIQAFLNGLDE